MKSPCRELRTQWIELASKRATRDDSHDRHLSQCAPCRAYLARIELHLNAFRDLRRRAVPPALDGRIVAATQAGFRQDRCIKSLESLPRESMPLVLDRRMWPDDVKAPGVLDGLVQRELEDPSQALARRFAGRLERLRAPRQLDLAVARRARGDVREAPSSRFFTPLVLGAAAATVLIIGLAGTLLLTRSHVQAARAPTIVIERVNSPAQMGAELQAVFVAINGGLSDARVLPKEKM